jgi:hypothetical protein
MRFTGVPESAKSAVSRTAFRGGVRERLPLRRHLNLNQFRLLIALPFVTTSARTIFNGQTSTCSP